MSSTTTPNLGLYKATLGTQEPADVSKYNANFDTLDNALTLTGAQTTTNKVLTSPTLTTPSMTSPTITTGTMQLSGGSGIQLGSTAQNTAPQVSNQNSKSDGTYGFIEVRRRDSDSNKIGFRLANSAYTDGWDLSIASGNTGSTVTLVNIGTGAAFSFDAATPSLAIGTNPAAAGSLRLPNNAGVNWRNAANSADLSVFMNASDQLALTVGAGNVGTSVGAAGGATALPATPSKYLLWVVNGVAYHIPMYA